MKRLGENRACANCNRTSATSFFSEIESSAQASLRGGGGGTACPRRHGDPEVKVRRRVGGAGPSWSSLSRSLSSRSVGAALGPCGAAAAGVAQPPSPGLTATREAMKGDFIHNEGRAIKKAHFFTLLSADRLPAEYFQLVKGLQQLVQSRVKCSRIELGDVTPHNIKQLKRLNQVIFPVSYNDKFYKDVLEVGELAKLAYFNDIAVGAVCCRVDHSQNQKRLYIMTLGCLAPYRRHVQISNESAIDFYRKFGFEIIETKKNYYKRIEPADAHVLQKNLKVPCLGQNTDVQKSDN
ncbi:hypothetical protein JD844_009970 [Phrynosoma platyrhinos]|uniref:N-acetyltransferase domain-containing protein n=1 Tax=Phrynosoma platyrhinos TaxID=52577 RepID=A0ABQ7TGL0_PHRPL|nr:hypothetical protein JD844_009970 [Phrynosoma platyrhinos]